MLYAALTFWLFVAVFCAWGIHSIWSGLLKPRAVNSLLLPGTLAATIGHVVGLLITGNPIRNTVLMSDDKSGEPKTDTPETPRIPIIGAIVVGLLPLTTCCAGLYLASRWLGGDVLPALAAEGAVQVAQRLPSSLDETWELLRSGITLAQTMLAAVLESNLLHWQNALFLYLAVCLTVRMAPIEGNRRGTLAAILLGGLVVGVLASLAPAVREFVLDSWPILGFAIGMLLFLLIVSLLAAGVVRLFQVLSQNR
ncbi:MAG: hypothetical protein AB7Q17_00610 [Phycisphaerae bacterium]